ncbi:TetR/AcrR family transcriptional regulator [Lysinibacillus telephonicus]|uniref:TetR/AcrR family transcriptional regulator n=1 Tax=Lysinibacillus telephonicus TaxID=1714840 RepID=A0A3S0JR36_9BACI|nr:TetR/AcrR family transcriptional regulator [Lysinibacillus telephonicus]RTQ94342.1 TetR/AcrR family transcriptional regulator [Lysinibacillus telephonicus]
MPKGRKVNSSGEKSKKLLLEKAIELFSTNGYHETKISDIVKAANLTQPTFYLYFQSKESLYKDLIEQFQNNFFEIVHNDLENKPSANRSFIHNIKEALVNIFTYFAGNLFLTKIGFYDSVEAESIKEKFALALSDKLQENQEINFSSEIEVKIFADMIVGAVERLTLTALFTELREPEQLAEDIVNIYFISQKELVR